MKRTLSSLVLALGAALSWMGCARTGPPPPAPALPAEELIFYNWAEYMPRSVLDAFTREYGVKVHYVVYDTQEEAANNIANGLEYDVAILPPEAIPRLIRAGRLAKIDYLNVPNFKHISANFRDLIYDPQNQYSIIFHWGLTGLLVRTDLVDEPVTRWADLWDPRFAGRIALWPIPRDLIPISLKSLGYKADSGDPHQLEEAMRHLQDIRPHAIWWDTKEASIVPVLASGKAVIAYGWAYDAQMAREEKAPIRFIIPDEGAFLWSDNFVIPASSRRKHTAEAFINFLLRPDISAQIVNESYYPMANEAATPLIDPKILSDPVVYPSDEQIRQSEIIVPLDEQGEDLYMHLWRRWTAGDLGKDK